MRRRILEDRETNPLSTDTDGDGFEDGAEDANVNGMRDTRETDPRYADSDRDGLPDSVEDTDGNRVVNPGETDPLNPDSDGDGVYDGAEDRMQTASKMRAKPTQVILTAMMTGSSMGLKTATAMVSIKRRVRVKNFRVRPMG